MSHRLEIDSEDIVAPEPPQPRRWGVKAVVGLIALAGVAGGAWWAYRSEKPRLPLAAVPVIHSDTAPVKEAPKNPGGMVVPDKDSVLLNRDGKNVPKVEQLLPEAEPVLPRPAAPPKPAAPPQELAAPAKPVPTAEPNVVPAKPEPPQAVQEPPPLAQPAAPPNSVVVAPPPVAAPVPKAASPTTPPAVASGPGYRLQLGAVRSEDAAKQEWEKLKRAQPDLLGKLTFSTGRVDLGDRGIYYRIQAGPIADANEATQSCATLKSRNVGCILVKP
jgi:hypothetical protein